MQFCRQCLKCCRWRKVIWEKSISAISLKCFQQSLLKEGAIQPPAILLANILKDDICNKSFSRKITNLRDSVKMCKSNICSKLLPWTLRVEWYSYKSTTKSYKYFKKEKVFLKLNWNPYKLIPKLTKPASISNLNTPSLIFKGK